MTKTLAKTTAAPAATSAPAAAGFTPTMVHAWRRQPHMVPGPNGVGEVEKAVEIAYGGKKAHFKSNDAGHIVGLVSDKVLFDRLVKEIPEAYIVYADGENLPEILPAGEAERLAAAKPEGDFVLQSSDGKYVVLDTMSDDDLRAFAVEAGIEKDALHESFKDETLRRAIYNLLRSGQ